VRKAPSRRRIVRVLAVPAVVIVIGGAFALFNTLGVRPTVFTTSAVGKARLALLVPPGWTVDPREQYSTGPDSDAAIGQCACIRPAPAVGLQRWFEDHFDSLQSREWRRSYIACELMQVGSYRDLNHEARRLAPVLNSMAAPGGIIRSSASTCPMGPLLMSEVERSGGRSPGVDSVQTVFPPAAPGEPQYEVVVRYKASGQLNGRLRGAARDVVSSLRLVKD
jgi:hypothetical protein